jgi:hypothetical protein
VNNTVAEATAGQYRELGRSLSRTWDALGRYYPLGALLASVAAAALADERAILVLLEIGKTSLCFDLLDKSL